MAAASGHAAQFLTFFTLLEPGDEFIASRNLYGGSLTQFGLSFKKLGWTCHFVDPTDPENFRTALTEAPRRSSSKASPIPAASSSISSLWRRSRMRPASPSWSTTRWRRRSCAVRSTGALTSSAIPPPNFLAATAIRWAAWWLNRENSTGRSQESFRPWPARSRPITASISTRRSATSASRPRRAPSPCAISARRCRR